MAKKLLSSLIKLKFLSKKKNWFNTIGTQKKNGFTSLLNAPPYGEEKSFKPLFFFQQNYPPLAPDKLLPFKGKEVPFSLAHSRLVSVGFFRGFSSWFCAEKNDHTRLKKKVECGSFTNVHGLIFMSVGAAWCSELTWTIELEQMMTWQHFGDNGMWPLMKEWHGKKGSKLSPCCAMFHAWE